jgi:short-subunit dehydrogenase
MARRQLTGKRVLITGASQGIGEALAIEAAKRGCRVVAAARTASLLEALEAKIRQAVPNAAIHSVAGDVSDPAGRQAMLDACHKHFGGLDILINNAGIGATGHFAETEFANLRRIFEVNVFGMAELTRLCIPALKLGSQPLIVNISSALGKRGYPARSYYSSSKFAVQGLSDAIRAELTPDGIGVLVVSPGLTQTHFSQNMLERSARLPLDHLRGMTSGTVAKKTFAAIAADKSDITLTMNGKLLVLVNRFAPWIFELFARKKIQRLFKAEIAEREKGIPS